MTNLFTAMALAMGSWKLTPSFECQAVTVSSSEWNPAQTRNGGTPSGAARLKRSAIKRSMAKARASKR